MQLLISSLILVTLLPVFTLQQADCENGMVYSDCGSPCTLTCDNYQSPPICFTVCASGCFCPQGTVENNGQCIDPTECPGAVTTTAPPPATTTPQCSNGMVYSDCGSPCTLTCDNYQSPPICLTVCAPGCFCPQGTVENNGQCIDTKECPGEVTTTAPPPVTTTPQCSNGKVYSTCGSACPVSCDSPHSSVCTFQCVIGCFCPHGTVEYENICVHPDQCPGVTVPPPSPNCTIGKVYSTHGSPCPLSCDNPVSTCAMVHTEGCFCPHGKVEYMDACVHPDECPETTAPPTTTTPPPVTTDPQCSNGKVYSTCGSACPVSCDNPHSSVCTFQCVIGCFCPHGTVEYEDICVHPDQCPGATTPSDMCSNGKVYSTCGSACPVSCDSPHSSVCTLQCVTGCFCPHGRVEYGDICLYPDECPIVTTPTTPTTPTCPTGMQYRECGPICKETCGTYYGTEPNLCFSLRCAPGCFCPDDMIEHEGECIQHIECPNADLCRDVTCPQDRYCEVNAVSRQPECKKPAYVPCTVDTPIACDSEFLRCIVQNKTRQATCLPSCFLDNGNCDDKQTCIVTATDYGSTIDCLNINELPRDCPAGMIINECGSLCQETCDDTLSGGLKACPLVCGPPACVCSNGLVRYRDRCVDPRECYMLDLYPPEVKPLPTVRSDMALFKMTPRDASLSREDFNDMKDSFLNSLEQLLNDNQHTDVDVELHAVYVNGDKLELYVQLSGGEVSSQTVDRFVQLLTSGTLSVPIDEVVVVDVPTYTDQDVLSLEAIVGIAVGGGVLLLAALVVMVTCCCCCCMRRKSTKKDSQQSHDDVKPSSEAVIYSELVSEGMGYEIKKENIS